MFVSLEDPTEAYYLAGAISSLPSRSVISAYTTLTGISTHVLENVSIPRFKSDDSVRHRIAKLSERCHIAIMEGDDDNIADLESDINKITAKLWGITDTELKFLQDMINSEGDYDPKLWKEVTEDE